MKQNSLLRTSNSRSLISDVSALESRADLFMDSFVFLLIKYSNRNIYLD